MHQEKYSLTWHTYSDHLKNMMKELMMNEDYSDVTLVTEDKKYLKANGSILSACSPIFKEIFKRDKSSNTIMYLRGIQFSEMESILQFIYLGEATFYEERMDEFVAVAKSLEITELCNAESETNNEPDAEPLQSDPVTPTDKVEEQDVTSDVLKSHPKQERRREVVGLNGRYECEPCQKTFTHQSKLSRHIQSMHEGIKYACDECDYQATQQAHLTIHIQSKHEGVKYGCNQCDYQATHQSNLKKHIQSKHEGVKYACDQCDYQATQQSSLTVHIQSKHEGIRYACDKCDYQATQKVNLRKHILNKH